MLEILGIRTGVEDDEDSSDDEDSGTHWTTLPGGMAMQNGPGSRRYAGQNGRALGGYGGRKGRGFLGSGMGDGYQDMEEGVYATSPTGSATQLPGPRDPYRTSIGDRLDPPRLANAALVRGFSTTSSSEEEDEHSDDGELLPSAHSLDLPTSSSSRQGSSTLARSALPRRSTSGAASPDPSAREGMVFRDGQWFTALDERYLLPLFSNSVASRRHHARRQSRMASSSKGGDGGDRREGDGDEGSSDEDREDGSQNGKAKVSQNFG